MLYDCQKWHLSASGSTQEKTQSPSTRAGTGVPGGNTDKDGEVGMGWNGWRMETYQSGMGDGSYHLSRLALLDLILS